MKFVDTFGNRSLRRLALLAALSLAVGACSKCGNDAKDGVEANAATTEAPVPAPDGLLADVFVSAPNTTWAKIQRGVGGAVGILPASAGGIACAVLGLDASLGSEIDGAMPAFGVVVGDPANPAWTVALKVVEARHARTVLFDGETARFTAHDLGDMTELVGKGGTSLPHAVALTRSGYLVVGRSMDDLTKLAPYVTRTLPSEKLPRASIAVDVPHAALATVLGPKLASSWGELRTFLLAADERERNVHGGRAPDYGDPKAIVAALDALVGRRIEVVGDLEKLRMSVDPDDDGVQITTTLTPRETGPSARWVSGMKLGELGPLTKLPSNAAVAVLWRDGEEERAAQASDVEKTLTASLGTRLAEADAKRLHDVFVDLAKARGETTSFALLWDEPEGLLVRGALRDADAARRALRGTLDLARSAPFKEWLRLREVTTTTEDVGDLGKASVATFLSVSPSAPGAAGPKRALPAGFGASDAGAGLPAGAAGHPSGPAALAWVVSSDTLALAAGREPLVTLRVGQKPEQGLGDEPVIARALAPLGDTASAVVLAQPLKFDATRAHLPTAPVVVAVGRREKDGYVHVGVGFGVLREVARRQMGL